MMGLEYIPCQSDDAPVIFSLSKTLIDQYEDKSLIDYEKVLLWVQKKIINNIQSYTRVQIEGKTVGYFHLDEQSEQVELDDFYVLPEYRGKGIGTQILNACVKTKEKPMFLYVFKKNVRAIALYKRMGFVETEDIGSTRSIMVRNG